MSIFWRKPSKYKGFSAKNIYKKLNYSKRH